jgi:nucleoside phosphorylase
MKILVVDDTYAKVQAITAALHEANVNGWSIRHESTAHAARIAMRESVFDLLMIDLHLPDVVGAAPTKDGGRELFDLLVLDSQVHLPADVIFVTAREDLLLEAQVQIEDRGAQLCHMSEAFDGWKRVLAGRVRFIEKRVQAHKRHEVADADIAIITALPTPELSQVLALPYGWKVERRTGDPTTVHRGVFSRGDRNINIVAAVSHRKGMPSAAALAGRLTMTYRPRYLVMLGICAGFRDKVGLGEIVVADPTWDWGAGKYGVDSQGESVFLEAPHQMSLSPVVSQLARDLVKDARVLSAIRAEWRGAVPEGTLAGSVGPLASGASVIADSRLNEFIAAQHKDLLGIEMEGYAVMAAAEYCPKPGPTAIVIKSVCDFADSLKSNTWQDYAAFTSARFAHHLFVHPAFDI